MTTTEPTPAQALPTKLTVKEWNQHRKQSLLERVGEWFDKCATKWDSDGCPVGELKLTMSTSTGYEDDDLMVSTMVKETIYETL